MSKMVISRNYHKFTMSSGAIEHLSTCFDEDYLMEGSLIGDYLYYLRYEQPALDGKNPFLVWCVEELGNAAVYEDTQLAVCEYDDCLIEPESISLENAERYHVPVGTIIFRPKTEYSDIERYFRENDLDGLLLCLGRHSISVYPAKA